MDQRLLLACGLAFGLALYAGCSGNSGTANGNGASGGSAGGTSGSGAGMAGSPGAGTGGSAGGLLTCSNSAAVTTSDAGTAKGVVAGMVPGPGTFVGGCQIFPATNAWNMDVSSPNIATTSIYSLPQSKHLHPDFGGWSASTGGPYGIPFNLVPATQPDVPITFNAYASESDPGPGGWTTNPNGGDTGVTAYPIPNNAKIEGDPPTGQVPGDDHLLVLQQGASCGAPCTLWEAGGTVGGSGPPWTADCGATWNLSSNALRPLGGHPSTPLAFPSLRGWSSLPRSRRGWSPTPFV